LCLLFVVVIPRGASTTFYFSHFGSMAKSMGGEKRGGRRERKRSPSGRTRRHSRHCCAALRAGRG